MKRLGYWIVDEVLREREPGAPAVGVVSLLAVIVTAGIWIIAIISL